MIASYLRTVLVPAAINNERRIVSKRRSCMSQYSIHDLLTALLLLYALWQQYILQSINQSIIACCASKILLLWSVTFVAYESTSSYLLYVVQSRGRQLFEYVCVCVCVVHVDTAVSHWLEWGSGVGFVFRCFDSFLKFFRVSLNYLQFKRRRKSK